MKEVLSQSEIDELINSIGKGEVDLAGINEQKDTFRKYDFLKPSKLSREQTKAMGEIYQVFSRLLIPSFSTLLRTYCTAQLQFVEEQTYYEYVNSIPASSFICSIPFLSGNAFLEFSGAVANVILDKILGGKGDIVSESSSFSDIEHQLMKRVIKQMIPYLNDSWTEISEKSFGDQIDISGQHENMYPPNEITIIVSMKLQIGSVEGYLNISIPYVVLESLIKNLSRKTFAGRNYKQKENVSLEEYMAKSIENARIELRGILGNTTLTFDQVNKLKRGDIIRLDKPLDHGVEIYVENMEKYRGVLGSGNGNFALKIVQPVEEKEA